MALHGRKRCRSKQCRSRRPFLELLEPRALLSAGAADLGALQLGEGDLPNEAPSFVKGPDQTLNEDAPAQSVLTWATEISPGPAEEAGQQLEFVLTTDNDELFIDLPAIDPATGTLTFTPAPDAFGVATVTVTLKDDGGTENGGSDTSAEETFTIPVNPVNDPPLFDGSGDTTVEEDSGMYAGAGWATQIAVGPVNEAGQLIDFRILVENDDLFAILPSIDSLTGDLTFELAPNAYGTAVIRIWLVDDGGTENGGVDTSPEQTITITVTPANDAPTVADPAEDQTTPQRAPFSYTLPDGMFEDVDGDSMTYEATSADGSPLPPWLSFDPATRTFSGTPTNDDVGTVSIKVTATDPAGDSAEDEFSITVTNVNDAPVPEPGGPYYLAPGQDLVLDGSGSYDPDAPFGDSIQFYRWDIGDRGTWLDTGAQVTIPWEQLAGLNWDLPVPVRLEVTDGFGVSSMATAQATTPSPIVLEPLDFTEITSPDLSAGDAWYRIPASRDGWFTIAASREDVELALYNESLGILQTSPAAGGTPRLDRLVTAGETLYVRLSSDTGGTADLRMANLVEHVGDSVKVIGTAGDDTFRFDATAAHKLVIHGFDYEFSLDEATSFLFDGFGGSDRIEMVGAGGAEEAVLRPTEGTVTGEAYTLHFANVRTIAFDGGGGIDEVELWGSRGQNVYHAHPGWSEMSGDGVSIVATAERIFGRGYGGGDTVTFHDAPGDDVLEYFPVWARMTGEGYFHHVRGFRTMIAQAELDAGGSDKVVLRGSGLNDYLKVNPYNENLATSVARFLSGTGSVWHTAYGFETVVAYGRGGGLRDQLFVDDSPVADTFDLGRLEAKLTTETGYFSLTAQGFGSVEVHRKNEDGGEDKVNLTDSRQPEHNDTLVGNPEQVTMSGPGYSNSVHGFPLVRASSSGEGHDTAYFSDFTGPDDVREENDTFEARPTWSQLSGPGYTLWAYLFDEVYAEAKLGSDLAILNGSPRPDQLTGTATEISLAGTNVAGLSYANYARHFDEIRVGGGGEQDQAVLTDAVVDEPAYEPPQGVALDSLAQALRLDSFERIELLDSSSGGKSEINDVDAVFAYWPL